MESIVSTFHIDWKIIVAQLINFGIVLAVLYFFALKPLNKLMSERAEKIGKGVADAKTNAETLAATKKEYDAALASARAEAATIFQTGKKEAEAKRTEMMEAAKSDVAKMIESGKKNLETEKVKMVDEAKKEIISLTIEATKKLLAKSADASFDEQAAKHIGKIV